MLQNKVINESFSFALLMPFCTTCCVSVSKADRNQLFPQLSALYKCTVRTDVQSS